MTYREISFETEGGYRIPRTLSTVEVTSVDVGDYREYLDSSSWSFLLSGSMGNTSLSAFNGTQIYAINFLVNNLKIMWSSFDVIYPFVGGTAETHKLNLINPSLFQIIWSGDVIHNNIGITCNSGFGNTQYNALSARPGQENNFSMSVYKQAHPGTAGSFAYMGCESSSGVNLTVLGYYASGTKDIGAIGAASSGEYSPGGGSFPYVSGLHSVITNGDRVQNTYRRGVLSDNPTTGSRTFQNINIYLLASSTANGTPINRKTGLSLSFSSIGSGRSTNSEIIFNRIIERFQTILERSVL